MQKFDKYELLSLLLRNHKKKLFFCPNSDYKSISKRKSCIFLCHNEKFKCLLHIKAENFKNCFGLKGKLSFIHVILVFSYISLLVQKVGIMKIIKFDFFTNIFLTINVLIVTSSLISSYKFSNKKIMFSWNLMKLYTKLYKFLVFSSIFFVFHTKRQWFILVCVLKLW